MSQIKIKQVDDNNLIVSIPPETPIVTVNGICDGFVERGLVEDLMKSTSSNRYFFLPKDKANDLADELIKSLSGLTGLSKMRSPENVARDFAHQAAKRKMKQDQGKRSAGPAPLISPAPRPSIPNTAGAATLPSVPNHLVGEIGTNAKKSDYGPRGAGQYSVTDNIRRKLNNTSEQSGVGPNVNAKTYNTRTQAGVQTDPKLKRKQPVKKWTPAEIAEENKKRGLKKTWSNHPDFPNGDEMVQRYDVDYESGDDASARQLANMMNSKAMLRPDHRSPSTEDMIMAGQRMGLGESREVMKSQDENWGNSINNWMNEAVKPISNRFASEEEEMAYWNSIKVSDAPDGKPGF